MKYLCIVPYEYTSMVLVYRNSPLGIYKYASKLRNEGHEVELFNMYPLYRPRTYITMNETGLYYKGIKVTEHCGWRKCGNFEQERLYRDFHRLGLPLSELTNKLNEGKPDHIYIGNTFTFLWRSVYEIVAHCKKVYSDVPITVGGIYSMLCPEHAKASGADFVMTSEEKKAVDSFIRVDADFFEYMPDRIFVSTSVGCPNHCSYCAVHLIEGCHKVHATPRDIVNEMAYYQSRGIKRFIFTDANILVDFDRHFKHILDIILAEGLKLDLYSYGGVEAKYVTKERLQLMKRAGFGSINIPIECASDIVIRQWKRNNFVADWDKAISVAHEVFDKIKSFHMIGSPVQTIDDVKFTIDYLHKNGVEPKTLAFTPIPGTPDYEPFKNVDLEELNPALFPCAHSKMTVKDLNDIYCQYRNVGIKQIFTEGEILSSYNPTCRIIESGPPIPVGD